MIQLEIQKTDSKHNKVTMNKDRFVIKFGAKSKISNYDKDKIIEFCEHLYEKYSDANLLEKTLRSTIAIIDGVIKIRLQTNTPKNKDKITYHESFKLSNY